MENLHVHTLYLVYLVLPLTATLLRSMYKIPQMYILLKPKKESKSILNELFSRKKNVLLKLTQEDVENLNVPII